VVERIIRTFTEKRGKVLTKYIQVSYVDARRETDASMRRVELIRLSGHPRSTALEQAVASFVEGYCPTFNDPDALARRLYDGYVDANLRRFETRSDFSMVSHGNAFILLSNRDLGDSGTVWFYRKLEEDEYVWLSEQASHIVEEEDYDDVDDDFDYDDDDDD